MIKFIKYTLFCLLIALFIFSSIEIGKTDKSIALNTQTRKMQEKDYVNLYCDGIIEYRLADKTRIDCLTNEYAIEFDYAKKWAESIGQSLYYSKKTGKKPAVALIISSPNDKKYINRIKDVDKNITIFEIPANEYKQERLISNTLKE